MKKKYWIILVIAVVLSIGAVPFVQRGIDTIKKDDLSDASIKARFACNRITLELRETDVFCNPDFYRNTNISEEAYYKYMSCENRLKSPPTPEEKLSNPGGYNDGYEICADKNRFNAELVKFRQYLANLKEKN